MYKLFIVDDEKVERDVIRMFIESSNLDIHSIVECSSGKEALAQALSIKPDIILMDINMPSLNGLEVMEHLKISKINSKVIVSTAYGYFEYAKKALQLNAFDYLLKPVSESTLVSAINKAIDQLDFESQKAESDVRLHQFLQHIGHKAVQNLIQGNITEDILLYLDTIEVSQNTYGQCYFIKFDAHLSSEQKKVLRQEIKHRLAVINLVSLCHIKNNAIVFIIFFKSKTLFDSLENAVQNILTEVFKQNHQLTSFQIKSGIPFEDIYSIENSFASARTCFGDVGKSETSTAEYPPVDIEKITKQVRQYLENQSDKKITLDQIEKTFGYSKYYINRIFKQNFGTTIIDYHIHCKIEHAQKLLKNNNLSIRRISELLGYSDSNYFAWSFKKATGTSPTKYRYQQEKEDIHPTKY